VTSIALQRSLVAIAALVSLSLIHGTATADTKLRVVDTKLLPDKPDMSKLTTEAYLPK
jgi:hypothetical protein